MILSVSRRTDIPAHYSQWFMNRLEAGYVYSQNPMNPSQISRIPLSPDRVDCIVFWSKNPAPMLPYLSRLSKYRYYFQFTLNAYYKDIEPFLPSLEERIHTFCELSERIGKERVIWRYDPILFTKQYTAEFHLQNFRLLAERLKGHTNRCIISFLDVYPKIKKQISLLQILDPPLTEKRFLAQQLAKTAYAYGLEIFSCAEKTDLSGLSIRPSSCIDPSLISSLAGMPLRALKDRNQRKECGCCESVDIGTYNTCPNGCRYCYANYSAPSVQKHIEQYDPSSPLLCSRLLPEFQIRDKEFPSLLEKQIRFF